MNVGKKALLGLRIKDKTRIKLHDGVNKLQTFPG